MTRYDFVSATSTSLDELQTEILVLPFFADERPLSGAAGLIDWRLCGALTRKLTGGYLSGCFGEKGMVAAPPKLKAEGVLLVGLGRVDAFDDGVARRACAIIADALRLSKVSSAALVLPGRSLDLLSASDALQLWLAVQPSEDGFEEISIIEHAEEHRVLASLFDGLRRRAESPLG